MTHPSVVGFDRSARAYERARPDYPAEIVDWLVAAEPVELAYTAEAFVYALV